MEMQVIHAVEQFIDSLNHRSLDDPWCLERAADVADTIEAYEDAVKVLTAQQQEAVERYIAACEELEYSHVYIAYALGREHQRMGIPPLPPLVP